MTTTDKKEDPPHRSGPVIYGISCLHHDAALSVVQGNQILFASHAERFSRRKNDAFLCQDLIDTAIEIAGPPDEIVYYEKPFITRLRQFKAGQYQRALGGPLPRTHIRSFAKLKQAPLHHVNHHLSHAAAGYFTSGFDTAAVVVIDGVGENESITVWKAQGPKLEKILSVPYPHSLGLFYAAFTGRLGLRPNEEEFIMMAMAALGEPLYEADIRQSFFEQESFPDFRLSRNMHKGIKDWRPDLKDPENIAASVQKITEKLLVDLFSLVARQTGCRNLVYAGGMALNCVANEKIRQLNIFDHIWIMPNPGDAGASLGAALAHSRTPVLWQSPYLGFDINHDVDIEGAARNLAAGDIIGLANGAAEFGPRALGNRSLLADPRPQTMKDQVNEIKRREPFRPFAPIVLEEHAETYFNLEGRTAPYMQYAAACKFPDDLPAICHRDGSSRVQTVNKNQNPVIYDIIKRFYDLTGCPMLLNTSLNIRGQPIVNDWQDAEQFSTVNQVKVF